ncbi:polysaccharide deacetylase family protein [Paenibacillus alba]|uniref:Polysaccharide deacetylase family protein n=1 Tax=Paenibacillus alba TaxID=1197127 RepID=A0ABU6G8W5_9BACL|nr:polysaccharide deacetylase family protein [Paenibacillus alba]MEC0230386.1 polysaccharide deacetylase family protein [Paenibacillus alba]
MRERRLCFLFFLFAMIALSSCEAHSTHTASVPTTETVLNATSEHIPEQTPEQIPASTTERTPNQTLEPTVAPTLNPTQTQNIDPTQTQNLEPTPVLTSEFTSSLSTSALTLLIDRYSKAVPKKWGEQITGVRTHLVTKEKAIALTFDACGGKEGSGYDEKLINYLIKEHIPATLFINSRWIIANPDTFTKLAANPLFEIENHGTEHRPLSINGKPAYGIAGTKNVSEVIHEVTDNADRIEQLTGRRPVFFRSGTAYYDDVAAAIVHDLGTQLAGYNVLGDAGATYNTDQVYHALMKAKSGSIVLAHMNHPEKDTAEGIIKAIPDLQKAGFQFVQLSTYPLE